MADQTRSMSMSLFIIFFFNLIVSARSGGNIDLADFNALLEIRNSLTDVPVNGGLPFFSTWDFNSSDPCATFSGVTCDGFGRVTALVLGTGLSGSRGLAGSLSPWPGLSNLTELTQLILFPGIVTGSIPPQIGLLAALQVISLTDNRLTGSIPPSISNLKNLHTLDISRNRLSGSVPPPLTHLPNLKVLVLAYNTLSGRFPGWAGSDQKLLHLDFKSNRFTGPLPAPFPPSLRYLAASNNQMWGPLNGLQQEAEQLAYLDLSMNQFGGPLPSTLFRSSLSSLLLQRNNLSGGVPLSLSPSSSSSYGEGSIVDLSHNLLTGELSPALADVETLFLNNNRLIGKVPVEYANSVSRGTTRTLYLQHNYISEFPWDRGMELPDTASLCLSYNCMEPPPVVGLGRCPASAGDQLSRPSAQCSVFKNDRSSP